MSPIRSGKFVGTGLVCFSLLAFEIVTARILGMVLESHLAIFAIALAMLGMGAATSILTLGKQPQGKSDSQKSLSLLALVLGISYFGCFAGIALFSARTNSGIEAVLDLGGFGALVDAIRESLTQKILIVGFIMFSPYFLFGVFIVRLFQSCSEADYHRLYSVDLVGASLGCILAVIALDYFGYSGSLALLLVSTFLGSAAFAGRSHVVLAGLNILLSVITLWVLNTPGMIRLLEPQPAMSQLSRNYDKSVDVEELWHVWNAHSRVALLSMNNPDSDRDAWQVYAHENGEGWASVPAKDRDPADWTEFVTFNQPKRVLVLFAGVGRDMVDIDQLCQGQCEITGVEINRHMVDHAVQLGPEHISTFLSRPGINLVVAEAREFLERDESRYDAILLSWWGAGTSHFVGTSGRLAGYLYTKEAYETLLDHLNPGGTITLLNSSKAQSLVNFRDVFQERGLGTLDNRVVLVREPSDKAIENARSFYDILENMRLIIKPSGFSQTDMEKIQEISDRLQGEIILSPGGVAESYEIYGEIVNGIELSDLNKRLVKSHGTELSIVTDDRPFINELLPRSYYLDMSMWLGTSGGKHPLWDIARSYISFVGVLSVIAFVLILGPLAVKGGLGFSRSNFTSLIYFLSLGAGFILIEIGLVRKLGLLLGHPSYSLSVVLAGLIMSTGLGSLVSRRTFASGLLNVRRTAFLIVIYVLFGLLFYELTSDFAISLSLPLKAAIVLAFLFPLGFLMGHLFPQGLVKVSRVDIRLVPWAWAINSVTSTISVGLGYILSYPLGFSFLIYLGVGFYALLLILPMTVSREEYRKHETPVAVGI